MSIWGRSRGVKSYRLCWLALATGMMVVGVTRQVPQVLHLLSDPMNERNGTNLESNKQATCVVERFLETTFKKLPADSKVLIALFGALNSASAVTSGSELADRLWKEMRLGGCGPIVGQSEEVNWLKGVSDGILLITDYS